ncbi:MAG: M23 family metallopeptidase [Bacteroidota bacterium]
MIILTDTQVAQVSEHLAQTGLPPGLQNEMLDHLCCTVEHAMQEGASFERALADTLQNWPHAQLKKLHHSIRFTTKTKPMIIRLSAAAVLLAGFTLLSPLPWPEVRPATVTAHACQTSHYDEALPLLPIAFEPPTASPIAGVEMADILTAGFGMRIHPIYKRKKHHRGIDLKADRGTPVLATAAGKVELAREEGKFGLCVRIIHDDGYLTFFAHMSAVTVKEGEQVTLGQQIGAVGSTGQSTGPHLHYEVWKDNRPIDPMALLD